MVSSATTAPQTGHSAVEEEPGLELTPVAGSDTLIPLCPGLDKRLEPSEVIGESSTILEFWLVVRDVVVAGKEFAHLNLAISRADKFFWDPEVDCSAPERVNPAP